MERRKAKSSDDESTAPIKSAKAVPIPSYRDNPPPDHKSAASYAASFTGDLQITGRILLISCVCCMLVVISTVLGYISLYRAAYVLDSTLRLHEANGGHPSAVPQPSIFSSMVSCGAAQPEASLYAAPRRNRIAWLVAPNINSGYLDHVIRVFQQFGWTVITEQNTSLVPDFDVLWHHNYPFLTSDVLTVLQTLKPHQRINKIPNLSMVTNKVTLSTTGFPFIPASFRLPEDTEKLVQYAHTNPSKKFLRKNFEHRNIVLIGSGDELHTFLQQPPTRTFVQEYIEPASLIADRKYDLGIYTVVTNLRPLRVFTWDAEIGMRFCPQPYKAGDYSNLDTYVIADDYAPIWTIPELLPFYTNNDYSNKDTFVSYLKNTGHSDAQGIVDHIVKQCKRLIAETLLRNQQHMVDVGNLYRTTKHFFELVRFDFMLNERWEVYLIEANMSPNLSSGHFTQNRRIFEQVLFNMFTLLGFANSGFWNLETLTEQNLAMQVSDKDISVYLELCNGDSGIDCKANCLADFGCRLCSFCMNDRVRLEIKHAYIEYRRRYNFGLAFPPMLSYEEAQQWTLENPLANGINITALDEWDQVEFLWFRGKCLMDRRWCAP